MSNPTPIATVDGVPQPEKRPERAATSGNEPLDTPRTADAMDRSLPRNRSGTSLRIWVLNPPFLAKFSRPQRSPAVTKSGTLYFPIWLAYTVGVLEEAGHHVTFTDAPARGLDRGAVLQEAKRIAPALIVMDTSTPSIENDIQVAEEIKAILPTAFLVMVGTHVSTLPDETLRRSPATNAVARREYEYTIRDLASVLGASGATPPAAELETVAGLSFRANGTVVHNPDRPFIENLDALPWVSRVYKKHLQIRDYYNQNALYPMVTLMTSRGCPFHCTFCVYPQTFAGRKCRLRSVSDVVEEMRFVVREFPEAKSLFFEDDTLTSQKARCLELAEAIIASGLKIPWTANARADFDFDTMAKIKEAGCRELCVGFESGNQTTLDAMKKGTRVNRMLPFVQDARRAGILIHGCFMVGFPGETREDVLRTIRLAIELGPDTVQFYPVMVYPGTQAFEEYQRSDWITARSYRDWLTLEGLHNCVVRNETLSSADLVRLCDLARRKFYLRPRYVGYKLGQMVTNPNEFIRTAKAGRVFLKHLLLGSKV